jgi:hypothetical protein
MNPSERRRLFLLGLCLTATLAVAAVSGIDESDVSAEPPASREKSEPAAKEGRLLLAKISREAVDTVEADIFAARSWQPAPPPPPPPRPAAVVDARPTVPALPFAYAGQLGDPQTGKLIVYLTRAENVYTVSTGDVIEESYRIESITDRQINFVYLPTKAQQTLAIPGN